MASVILGKYEMRGLLGRGAGGSVYDAWDPIIARRVAIKTVKLPHADDPETADELARFKREAQAAGGLSHPNIVPIYDYGETDEVAYIVMEYVGGGSLKNLLDEASQLPLADTLRVMEQLLAGLQYSHDRGIVHRDVKPANVMLTSDKTVKITDFGIARIEGRSATVVGTMLGTPAYMSPEQWRGDADIDARTDIYAAGVVLYQLLTGQRPFDGGNQSAIMHKVLNDDAEPPSGVAVAAPPQFDGVVMTAMARNPEDRYQSAAAFAAALKDAMERVGHGSDPDSTVVRPVRVSSTGPLRAGSTPPVPPPVVAKPSARRGIGAMLAVVGVIVVAGGGAGAWLLLREAAPDQHAAAIDQPADAAKAEAARVAAAQAAAESSAAEQRAAAQAEAARKAAEQAAAEKAAADQKTAAQAEASRKAAEQAAEQAEAARKTAERVAADKAAADQRAAAQAEASRRTAEQAAAAKATADKQAAEQVEAARKAAERVAAEQAVAAKAAADKEAAAQAEAARKATELAAISQKPDRPAATTEARPRTPREILAAVPCAAVYGDDIPARMSLHGIVPDDHYAALHYSFQQVVADNRGWDVEPFPALGIYCQVIDTLRPALRGLGEQKGIAARLVPSAMSHSKQLSDNDPIDFEVDGPDFASFLQVDYVGSDGKVSHYMPRTAQPSFQVRRLRANEHVRLFDIMPGAAFQVGPPYGTDLVVIIASSEPLLVPRTTDDDDSVNSYVAALHGTLDAARRRGVRVSVALVPVETVEAKP